MIYSLHAGRLQTIPMHNYPTFLNLLTTFVYVRTACAPWRWVFRVRAMAFTDLLMQLPADSYQLRVHPADDQVRKCHHVGPA